VFNYQYQIADIQRIYVCFERDQDFIGGEEKDDDQSVERGKKVRLAINIRKLTSQRTEKVSNFLIYL
jgi:hypothetical protein